MVKFSLWNLQKFHIENQNSLHSVEITLTLLWPKFRESNVFAKEITKYLIWRNFCQWDTVYCGKFEKWKIYVLVPKIFSSDQLFINFFSNTVIFTTLLPKKREGIPVISTLCESKFFIFHTTVLFLFNLVLHYYSNLASHCPSLNLRKKVAWYHGIILRSSDYFSASNLCKQMSQFSTKNDRNSKIFLKSQLEKKWIRTSWRNQNRYFATAAREFHPQ